MLYQRIADDGKGLLTMWVKLTQSYKRFSKGEIVDLPQSIASTLIAEGGAEQFDPFKRIKKPPKDKMIRQYRSKSIRN